MVIYEWIFLSELILISVCTFLAWKTSVIRDRDIKMKGVLL